MRLSIVGTGHVGLVTGACLADIGNDVLCVDVNPRLVQDLKQGFVPFFEPGLQELVKEQLANGTLHFGSTVAEAVAWANVVFVCVGTPPNEDGSSNTSSVKSVAREIAENAHGYYLIVEKSTVPVNTGRALESILELHGLADAQFDVASVPEFLREGSAIYDVLHPDRTVIGASTQRAIDIIKTIYQPILSPVVVTDVNTAEIIKHASNSFLAMKISYINAIAQICERTDADVSSVAVAVGLDHRIGPEFLEAGIGYGGSCFPKDVAAFIQVASSAGYEFDLLRAVQQINSGQQEHVVKMLQESLGGLEGRCIAVLGLAFKPNTDDIRDSPAIRVVEQLLAKGASVRAFDPKAMPNARMHFQERIHCSDDEYDAAKGADAIVLLTQWNEFTTLDWARISGLLRGRLAVDGRNVWHPDTVNGVGLTYLSIGRSGRPVFLTL